MSHRFVTKIIALTGVCMIACAIAAENTEAVNGAATTIPLWPDTAPGSENWTQQEVSLRLGANAVVRNVVRPSLTMYTPAADKANGSAVIICPGGGFLFLTMDAEGSEVADWLTARGVTAFVLKYRLSDTGTSDFGFKLSVTRVFLGAWWNSLFSGHPTLPTSERIAQIAPLAAADGARAMKIVRERAAEWHIDPQRIGMIGFSAGGTVVNEAATQYDASSRPDFVASIYGTGLRLEQIPSDAPPIFLAAAKDDPILPSQLSVAMDSVWRNAGHASELHIYENGGHGFGIRKQKKSSDRWIDDYEHWLQAQHIIAAPATGDR